ncbi:MAG TPA: hypothetical protein VHB46_10310 [Burkholderiales bacterium]|nr:hypothetical protein [Burkholderiales bacterium]
MNRTLLASVFFAIALTACGKKEAAPVAPPPAPTAAPAPAPAADAAKPADATAPAASAPVTTTPPAAEQKPAEKKN